MSSQMHIQVTPTTYRELRELKGPTQTYDELIRELAQQRRRCELAQRLVELETVDRDDLTAIKDI